VWAVAAAVADVFENIVFCASVNAPLALTTQGMVDAIRIPSLIKWALVWIATAIFAWLFCVERLACGGRSACWMPSRGARIHRTVRYALLVWAGIPIAAGDGSIVALPFRPR